MKYWRQQAVYAGLHDVGEAASGAEHEWRVPVAVADVDVAVRVE